MVNISVNNRTYAINENHINAILYGENTNMLYMSSGDKFEIDDDALAQIYDALGTNYFKSIELLEGSDEYLYKVVYDSIDYNIAQKYFTGKFYKPVGGDCTSFRAGNFCARNFDLYYNYNAIFVVVTPRSGNRCASIGVAGFVNELTKDTVEDLKFKGAYKRLPFYMLDGVNEYGVYCNNNVVPKGDKGITTGTHPGASESVCMTMLPRYVLDNFKSAKEAVSCIKDKLNIWAPDIPNFHYETHFLIADAKDTYIVEFVNNTCIVNDCASSDYTGAPIMTNFYTTDVKYNDDRSLYTPYTQDAEHNAYDTNNVTLLGSGLERYNKVLSQIDSIITEADAETTINSVEYSKAYTLPDGEDKWYTEFVGVGDLNVKSNPEDFADIVVKAKEAWETRSRDKGDVWCTVHSSVYDLENKTLLLHIQENKDVKWKFDIDGNQI